MSLVVAAVFAVLVGTGAHLMTRNDLIKLVAGTLLITNAAVLLLVAGGFDRHVAPILPADPRTMSDPLVQALALTAVAIGFGTTVILLRIALAVERSHGTIDVEELVEAELEEGEDDGAEGRPDPDAEDAS